MLKLINYNNEYDINNDNNLSLFINSLLNKDKGFKILITNTKIYKLLNQNLNYKCLIYNKDINDLNQIIKLSKNNNVYILNHNLYYLLEPFCDELIIIYNKNHQTKTHLNYSHLNWFLFKKQFKFHNYIVYKYISIKNKLMFAYECFNEIKNQLAINIKQLTIKNQNKLCLAIISINNNKQNDLYIKNKLELAKQLNIKVVIYKLKTNITEQKVINKINQLNHNKNIHGIFIQLPLPLKLNKQRLFNSIHPNKDVEGLNSINIAKWWTQQDSNEQLVPCTSLAIWKLLTFYNIDLNYKNVILLGRSDYIIKPLINFLLNKNATIQICHSYTNDLNKIIMNADIIITATGKINLINKNNIKKNVIIIDAGINYDLNNKLVGDVNMNKIINKVKLISPVPGGVGKLTTIMLYYNLLICYKKLTSSN